MSAHLAAVLNRAADLLTEPDTVQWDPSGAIWFAAGEETATYLAATDLVAERLGVDRLSLMNWNNKTPGQVIHAMRLLANALRESDGDLNRLRKEAT